MNNNAFGIKDYDEVYHEIKLDQTAITCDELTVKSTATITGVLTTDTIVSNHNADIGGALSVSGLSVLADDLIVGKVLHVGGTDPVKFTNNAITLPGTAGTSLKYTDIADNITDTKQNTTQIAATLTTVTANTTDIATNKTAVAKNTVDIANLQPGGDLSVTTISVNKSMYVKDGGTAALGNDDGGIQFCDDPENKTLANTHAEMWYSTEAPGSRNQFNIDSNDYLQLRSIHATQPVVVISVYMVNDGTTKSIIHTHGQAQTPAFSGIVSSYQGNGMLRNIANINGQAYPSDKRIKDNIRSITEQNRLERYNKVKDIDVVSFRIKENYGVSDLNKEIVTGFTTQNLLEVGLTDCVIEQEKEETHQVPNVNAILGLLFNTIQILQKKVEDLENR